MLKNSIIKLFKGKMMLVIVDLVLITSCLYLAFLLRFEGGMPRDYANQRVLSLLFFLPVQLMSLYLTGVYRVSLRYIGLPEIMRILKSCFYSLCVLAAMSIILNSNRAFLRFPMSILLIDFLLIFLLISGSRLSL